MKQRLDMRYALIVGYLHKTNTYEEKLVMGYVRNEIYCSLCTVWCPYKCFHNLTMFDVKHWLLWPSNDQLPTTKHLQCGSELNTPDTSL